MHASVRFPFTVEPNKTVICTRVLAYITSISDNDIKQQATLYEFWPRLICIDR